MRAGLVLERQENVNAMQMEYKELNREFWGRHLWAGGCFVASSGNVTDEIIKMYIQNQDLQEKSNSDNFEIG